MSELIVVARFVAKNESIENLKSELLKLVEPTRKEVGCIRYKLLQDNENPEVFVFIEKWENSDYLGQHMNTPLFKSVIAAIDGMTEEITVNKLNEV